MFHIFFSLSLSVYFTGMWQNRLHFLCTRSALVQLNTQLKIPFESSFFLSAVCSQSTITTENCYTFNVTFIFNLYATLAISFFIFGVVAVITFFFHFECLANTRIQSTAYSAWQCTGCSFNRDSDFEKRNGENVWIGLNLGLSFMESMCDIVKASFLFNSPEKCETTCVCAFHAFLIKCRLLYLFLCRTTIYSEYTVNRDHVQTRILYSLLFALFPHQISPKKISYELWWHTASIDKGTQKDDSVIIFG